MRSKWKGAYTNKNLRKELSLNNIVKTFNRESDIIPEFVNKIVEIHNGKNFIKLEIKKEYIGYKLGSFSITKKRSKKLK